MAQQNDPEKTMLRNPRLEIRGRTMVFDNTICSIPNISALEAGTMVDPLPLPLFAWLVLSLAATGYALTQSMSPIRVEWGVGALAVGVVFLLLYLKSRWTYGLIIRLNSGHTRMLISKSSEFVQSVVTVLRAAMDHADEEASLTFNFDQRTIVDNVTGSTIVSGSVGGDVVTRI